MGLMVTNGMGNAWPTLLLGINVQRQIPFTITLGSSQSKWDIINIDDNVIQRVNYGTGQGTAELRKDDPKMVEFTIQPFAHDMLQPPNPLIAGGLGMKGLTAEELEIKRKGTVIDLGDVSTKHTDHPDDTDLRRLCASITDGEDGFPPDATARVMALLTRYRKSIWKGGFLPPLKNIKYDLPHGDDTYVMRPIPISAEYLSILNDQVDAEIKGGLLREIPPAEGRLLKQVSNAFYKVEKKKLRRCINYVPANVNGINMAYNTPKCEDITRTLRGHWRYHSLDVKSAYNQLEYASDEHAIPWAFVIPGRQPGTTRYMLPLRAGFGDKVLPPFYGFFTGSAFKNNPKTSVYIDDINMFVDDFDKDLDSLEGALRIAEEEGLVYAFDKIKLFQKEIRVLGKIISQDGERPDPERVEEILKWPIPTTVKQLHSFLGVIGFIHDTSPRHTSKYLKYLQNCLKLGIKKKKINAASPTFQEAVYEVKQHAAKWILLAPINTDAPIHIVTDSSQFGYGYYLYQWDETRKCRRVIHLGSRRWPTPAVRYPSHELEAAALINAVRRFAKLLATVPYITLQTDNKPAAQLLSSTKFDELPFKFQRYQILLQQFKARVIFVSAKGVLVADHLSRQPYIIEPQSVNKIARVVEDAEFDAMIENDEGFETLASTQRTKLAHIGILHTTDTDMLAGTDGGTLSQEFLDGLYGEQIKVDGYKALMARCDTDQSVQDGHATYYLQNGCLMRETNTDGFTVHQQYVIPPKYRAQCLRIAHDLPLSGHTGEEGTYQRLKRQFYWKNMDADVKLHVARCKKCQLVKARLPKQHSFKTRLVSDLFATITCDLLEMTSMPSLEHNYILVVQDWFTKFILLIPLKTKGMNECIRAIHDRVIGLFGPPHVLYTDNGSEFCNSLMKVLKAQYGIAHETTPPFNPQGNGANERSHRSIMDMIRIHNGNDRSLWAQTLGAVQYAINTSPKKDTSVTPYDLMFCRKPREPGSQKPTPAYNEDFDNDVYLYGKDLRKQWATLERARRDDNAFAKRNPVFNPGDRVVVVNRPDIQPRNKSFPKGDGPYTVIRANRNGAAYDLRDEAGNNRTASVTQIKPFIADTPPTTLASLKATQDAAPLGHDTKIDVHMRTHSILTPSTPIGGEGVTDMEVMETGDDLEAGGEEEEEEPRFQVGDMVIAALDRESKVKLVLGQIDESTRRATTLKIRVYSPNDQPSGNLATTTFLPTYRHKSTGMEESYDGTRHSLHEDVTWELAISEILFSFPTLTQHHRIPETTVKSLMTEHPNSTFMWRNQSNVMLAGGKDVHKGN